MNKTVIILNKQLQLEKVVIEEYDTSDKEVLATKSLECLKKAPHSESYSKGIVYKLITHKWDYFTGGWAYNWQVMQCPFTDDSSIGKRYNVFETVGGALDRMRKDGFVVTIDGIELKDSSIERPNTNIQF